LDSAIHYSRRAVEIAPSERIWKRTLGMLHGLAGHYDEGLPECTAGVGDGDKCAATIGLLVGLPRSRESGLASLGALSRLPRALGTPTLAAMIYARLGISDSMFSRLRVAVERRDDSFAHLITSPAFTKYHSDPRWDTIVGEVRRR
jgi:hypothetical protein